MSAHHEPVYRVTDPATGMVLEQFPMASDAAVESAISSAHAAFQAWRATPMSERARIAARVGDLLAERAEELATIVTMEMGKRRREAIGEIKFCREIYRYFAAQGPALAADVPIEPMGGGRAVIQKRPIGVLLGVMPWNYPHYQVARFAAPNFLLGNTIVLKHAESCPRTALAIQAIMDDAGVPAGVYQNVFASHEQVATIIADPLVQGVSLTGSERAGTVIGESSGRNLKKVVLELGGSDPYIVLDAANVKESAAAAWRTRMQNAGQACNSNKRIIVMDAIYDEFVAAMVAQARSLRPGDPREDAPGTFVPLSSRAAAENLADQVRDAVEKGAVLHVGGRIVSGNGAFFEPAVLTGLTPGMRAWNEELFGPVAVIYKVSSDAEALALANNSMYGLGAAVFCTDPQRARRLADQLDVGMVSVNSASGEGPDLPFGGVKRSGFGRELGPLGMEEFANKRLFYVA